jgi:transposase
VAAVVHQVRTARALLLAADGVANHEIARRVGVTVVSVRRWRERLQRERVAGVGRVAAGRGRIVDQSPYRSAQASYQLDMATPI